MVRNYKKRNQLHQLTWSDDDMVKVLADQR